MARHYLILHHDAISNPRELSLDDAKIVVIADNRAEALDVLHEYVTLRGGPRAFGAFRLIAEPARMHRRIAPAPCETLPTLAEYCERHGYPDPYRP